MNPNSKHETNSCNDALTGPNTERKAFELLTDSTLVADNFYMTGFEAISFNRRMSFAVETVLSSVASFDSEVLIVNTGDRSFSIAALCDRLHIANRMVGFDELNDGLAKLKETLSKNRYISHLVVCEDDTYVVGPGSLKEIGVLATQQKVDFIVECARKPLTVRQAIDFGVSFLVSPILGCANKSLILARRSRLVQSEGRSRSMVHDLYRYWQLIAARRKHIIEPMAF
jgi:hypothetical protein